MSSNTLKAPILRAPRSRPRATHPAHGVRAKPRSELSLLAPLRLLANFSVVAHHMRGGDVFFGVRFGMFLFLAMMFALTAGSSRLEPIGSFTRRKFTTLLLPWMRWSLVYVALAAAVGLAREGGLTAKLEPWMLTAGGHASLWFLPFAFCALLAWRAAAPLLARVEALRLAVFASVLGLAALVASSFALELAQPTLPWDAWLRATPLIFWGIALGQTRRLDGRRRVLVLLIVPAFALLAWIAEPLVHFHDDVGRRTAVVMILLSLGLSWSPRLPRFVAWLGTLTYGIYLAHPLVAKILTEFADPFAWSIWTHALVVWSLAAVLVLVLRLLGVGGAEIQRRMTAA